MNIFETIVSKVFGNEPKAASAPIPTAQATPAATSTPQAVDVQQVISKMAERKGERLNWQTSIVDFMKVLDMDSSLESRKQLAQEMKFSGDT